ncbi:BnaCnng65220D [Brassica napus]|uniref:BnaCnng65220D protein n=1 Tax=Brassica napus TaxID=3708 RepID=A0A078JQD1_BRANA|nr:BnaCnng65220D [Brassica napus]
MTIISDLSWDLVEEILSRVPIISLGAVRSTCKRWNRLSKNRLLCKAEARRHQFLRFMVKNYKLCSMRFDLHGILDGEEFVDPSIKEITVVDSLNHVKRFGPPLPLPVEHYVDDTGTLSSLRDEKLAVLYQPTSMSDVQIWVTTKIEPSAVSWVPFLKIDVEPFTGFGFQFHHDGASFFIDEEKKVAVVFQIDESEMTCYDTAYLIGENGYFEKVGLGEAEKPQWSANNVGEYCPLVCSCSFVPSLVHINNESAGS